MSLARYFYDATLIFVCVVFLWRFIKGLDNGGLVLVLVVGGLLIGLSWILDVIATPAETRAAMAALPRDDPGLLFDTGDNVFSLLCGWFPGVMLAGVSLTARGFIGG